VAQVVEHALGFEFKLQFRYHPKKKKKKEKKPTMEKGQTWWYTPIIQATQGLEDCKFKASSGKVIKILISKT
jgi:hypothetical protein